MVEVVAGSAAAFATGVVGGAKITSDKRKQKLVEKYTEKYNEKHPTEDTYNQEEYEDGLKKAEVLDIVKGSALTVLVSTAVGICAGAAVAGIKALLGSDDSDDDTDTTEDEE